MLVQLTTRQMIMDPCYRGRHIMIEFDDVDPRIVVKRNEEKSLEWHLKKANAFLRATKVKAKIQESRFTTSILPPGLDKMVKVVEFEFVLLGQIPERVSAAAGVPIDHVANEQYCFEAQWSAAAIEQMANETPGHNNFMIEWYLRSTRYASLLDKKLFTKAKRAMLKQLGIKSGVKNVPEGQYWVGRP